MKPQDMIIVAAAAAFFLASGNSVNDSEEINVELPSQYQVIWDQSPVHDLLRQRDNETADRFDHRFPVVPGHVESWLRRSDGVRTPIFRPRDPARG